jgi:hypothetical protein
VLTHAHEDHIGAVPHLWSRLRCPLFATPFTAALVRHKLQEVGFTAPLHEVPLSGGVDVGPFTVDFIQITHSIPEPNVLAIRTAAGTIVHTGDWKLDPDLVKEVLAGAVGVLLCGSGIGMSIGANRFKGIRAALCNDGLMAKLAREHNDANILVFGERIIGKEEAVSCLESFLKTPFQGGRHARRVEKLDDLKN